MKTYRGDQQGSEGLVLVTAVMVIAVLGVLVLNYTYLIHLDARMASNFRDSLEADYLARSGVSQAMILLVDDCLGPLKEEEGVPVPSNDEKKEQIDHLAEEWALPREPVERGKGEFIFTIVDEDRKFNINSLVTEAVKKVNKARLEIRRLPEPTEEEKGAGTEKGDAPPKEQKPEAEGEAKAVKKVNEARLETRRLPEPTEEKKGAGTEKGDAPPKEQKPEAEGEAKVDEKAEERLVAVLERLEVEHPKDIVKNIIDWIDADDDGEAEGDYYGSLDPSYRAKNAPLETIGELALIKDVNLQIFEGELGRERIPEAKESEEGAPIQEEEDEGFPGLRNYLTVYSDGKININTVSEPLLEAILGREYRVLARDIISRRRERPFSKVDEIKEAAGRDIPSAILENFKVSSDFFTVLSEGRVGNMTSRVRAVIQRHDGELVVLYWRHESR